MQNESIYSPLIDMEDVLDRDITLEEAIQVLTEVHNKKKSSSNLNHAAQGAAVAGLGYGAAKLGKSETFKKNLYNKVVDTKLQATNAAHDKALAANQDLNVVSRWFQNRKADNALMKQAQDNKKEASEITDKVTGGMQKYGPYVAGVAGAYAGYKALSALLNMLKKKKQQALAKKQNTRQIDAEIAKVKAKIAEAK